MLEVMHMEEILRNMDPEKRDKIINSALEEFSKNSFEKASTNAIVKKAGISKGLLFHYFNSKQALYDHLEAYVIEKLTDAIQRDVNWTCPDLFDRLKDIAMVKIRMMNQHPYLYDFSLALLKNGSIEQLKQRYEGILSELMQKAYQENVDFSLFKEDVDIEKAVHIIQWTLEKIGEAPVERLKVTGESVDMDVLYKSMESYLGILKKAFYKPSTDKED